MQVICPNCAARYAVDPSAIGPTGRTVQCVRCSHRWFEKSPAVAPATPTRERPVPDFVIRPQPHYNSGLPALSPPRHEIHWGRWIAAVVALVLVLGVAAFAYRDEIGNRLPPEWRAILSLDGVPDLFASPARAMRSAMPDQPRLEIDLAASRVELVDGRYVVRGELVNTGGVAGSTTTLKLVFRRGEEVLGERAYPLTEGPIAPGARLAFSRSLDEPPDGTTNIVPTVE
jgi:predicted Zn finger-like uncharacterized protein